MIDLEKKSKYFNCVINYPLGHQLSTILDNLSSISGLTYFMIVHDKDVKSTGEIKTKHIHIGCILSTRKRAKTCLLLLCSAFGVKENQVQISEMLSISGAIQYLTHKNNKEKHQYKFDDIKTNMKSDDLKTFYEMTANDLVVSFDSLYDLIVTQQASFDYVVKCLGCEKYLHYRMLVMDIFRIYRNYDYLEGGLYK